MTTAARTSSKTSSRRELARRTAPIPCYNVAALPPKKGGTALYETLRTIVSQEDRSSTSTSSPSDDVQDKTAIVTLVERLVIPPKSARSWKVPAGHVWRIVCTTGPQVADMNVWSLENPDEHFYSSKTRQIHATHLKRGDRLWSNMPYLRPMATIIEDTIDYGYDEDGAGVHDVIGSRCDPYTHYAMTKENDNHCCHSNLTRQAVQHDGLSERHVHDVLNVFMCTGFTKDTHQYFTKPSPVDVGDYIEFLAEMDLLVSASTCPQGDVSLACGAGGEPTVYELGVEIYKIDMEWLTSRGWSPSEVNGYSGNHGI